MSSNQENQVHPEKDLSFSDLSVFDKELIKSRANAKYLDGQKNLTDAMIESVFECLNAKALKIVPDSTKKDTWSKPKRSWYANAESRRR